MKKKLTTIFCAMLRSSLFKKIMVLKKYIIFFILFILIQPNSLMGQVYVSPSTYIYAINQVIYLPQALELNATNSNFYLRKEAQLLQGTTGKGKNKGLGNLSVFQEGTVNNYAYNYWCSPVGGPIAAAGNSPFGITQLGVPTTTTATSPATMLAMNNYDGASGNGTLAIAPYWIWKFIAKDAYADWVLVGSNSTIAAGEGFTMKGVSGTDATVVDGVTNNGGSNQRYDFRGKPNDGTINITVAGDGTVAGSQFTLTGNPYPSAMDLNMFLLDASNAASIDGNAYFWESDKTVNSHKLASYVGGYGTYSPISLVSTGVYVPAVFSTFDGAGNYVANTGANGVNYERRFCPIGQGFMVNGMANATVQMKNSCRVFVKEGIPNHSQFEKIAPNKKKAVVKSNFLPAISSVSGFDYTTVSSLPVPQIRFKTIMDKGMILPMALAFDPAATDAVDFGMDATANNNDLDQEIYFGINNNSYIIDVIDFDVTKKIPLGLRNTTEATYKIAIDTILNFSDLQHIYIHDKDNDTYQNIKNTAYTVTMPAGTNSSRFEITFTNLSSKKSTNNLISNFEVMQDNQSQNLTILNPKAIDLTEVTVFDITGRLILNKSKLISIPQYLYATSGWSDGVYIVNLLTADNQTERKKIIVFNTK